MSIQKAQKFGKSIPGGYIQWIDYEKEKRPDVLYGYPNKLVSYPIPGTSVPPWLAEGVAQFMYPGADWDNWDSIRDMILRDRTLNNNLLTWTEMNVFGKSGIGNESVYNTGYAFTRYIAVKYGHDTFKKILSSLSKPFNYSVSKAIKDATAKDGKAIFNDLKFNKKNIKIITFNSLTTELCKKYNSNIILRGLRAVSDFEYEFQLAGMNRKLNKNIETIFLMSDVENQIISSKFVKEIASLGGDVNKFTTKSTIKALKNKYV